MKNDDNSVDFMGYIGVKYVITRKSFEINLRHVSGRDEPKGHTVGWMKTHSNQRQL